MKNIILLFGLFLSAIGCANTTYPVTDHYDGKVFFNPWLPEPKGFSDFLKWQWTRQQVDWPEFIEDNKIPNLQKPSSEKTIQVTFVNHASFYIQTKGLSFLTDPVFSERASPVSFAGPKRVRNVGLKIEQIPQLDVVLISHSHYDHLDEASVRQLTEKFNPLFIVPLKLKPLVESFGAKKVIELDWWQTHSMGNQGLIHLVPAQHWSARGIFDRNETLWGGYVVEVDGSTVYFSGDTGYGPHFKEIQKRWNTFDLTILPIGAYEPRWFMREQHMNPDDAVMAHRDLQSRMSLGCHFGTFQLTDEGVETPVIDLKKALEQHQVNTDAFLALKNGESITVPTPSLKVK